MSDRGQGKTDKLRDPAIPAHGAMACYSFLIATSFPVGAFVTHALDPIVLTFLRMLLGLIRPDAGEATADGHPLTLSLPDWARFTFSNQKGA